jgi:hypothetical protein
MNGKSPEFPPDFQFIRLRLEKYIFLICEEYDLWTCDQASQVICNIDYDGFTQNDRDNFLITSKILKAKAIAEKIKSKYVTGEMYFEPRDIIEWAIQNEYKLSSEIKEWYEDYQHTHSIEEAINKDVDTCNQVKTPKSKNTKIKSPIKRSSQLHQLIWKVYQSLTEPKAQDVWKELRRNHNNHDIENIIQEITAEKIMWCSSYGKEQTLLRSSFDKTLSNIKKFPPI